MSFVNTITWIALAIGFAPLIISCLDKDTPSTKNSRSNLEEHETKIMLIDKAILPSNPKDAFIDPDTIDDSETPEGLNPPKKN